MKFTYIEFNRFCHLPCYCILSFQCDLDLFLPRRPEMKAATSRDIHQCTYREISLSREHMK